MLSFFNLTKYTILKQKINFQISFIFFELNRFVSNSKYYYSVKCTSLFFFWLDVTDPSTNRRIASCRPWKSALPTDSRIISRIGHGIFTYKRNRPDVADPDWPEVGVEDSSEEIHFQEVILPHHILLHAFSHCIIMPRERYTYLEWQKKFGALTCCWFFKR